MITLLSGKIKRPPRIRIKRIAVVLDLVKKTLIVKALDMSKFYMKVK